MIHHLERMAMQGKARQGNASHIKGLGLLSIGGRIARQSTSRKQSTLNTYTA